MFSMTNGMHLLKKNEMICNNCETKYTQCLWCNRYGLSGDMLVSSQCNLVLNCIVLKLQ